ncbi:hypothetical protein [Coprococcus ammoniilyticus]|jgi:hypothetical protein|uniref:Uncharacterized protein n=1 Tax=Coprococcus ammoniilyticus TaxID=2981785 RepID=A0ABV1EEJ2_9FIRM
MSLMEEKYKYSIDTNIHFTYKADADMKSLCQGDVLNITEELAEVLRNVHPYFLNGQYRYFMVLSQSCDLVRRDGKNCKTPYITLAAIRSYDSFVEKTLVKEKFAENVSGLLLMDEKKKEKAYQLIERIYNNTEPEYFFLYKEDALDFPESMITYLKVSIALKSQEHYDKCLAAKKMELSDEFKAKLGWLVGNMYSRVGTADWEGIMTAQERKEMLNNDLESKCIIGSKDQLKILKAELAKKSEMIHNHEEAASFVSDIYVQTKYEKAMSIIEEIFQTSSKKIPKEEKEILLNKIKSRTTLKTLIS